MAEYIFEIGEALYNEKTGETVMKPTYKGKIVRCRECKHWDASKNCGYCDIWDHYISNEDFYCGCAERRKG